MTKPEAHWQDYAMEAAGLGGFVLCAGMITILMEHPDLWVMHTWLKDEPMLRRMPIGALMGGYIALVIVLAGKRSGAHINPAVTWAYWWLGRISSRNAVLYILAQFSGASVGVLILKVLLGKWFAHPLIHYGLSAPMPPYTHTEAFIAELFITFLLGTVTLFASTNRKWEGKIAVLSGLLIMSFIIFELPFSGMSMNPARSFAAALAANEWAALWIYFVAPMLGALLSAEVFLAREKRRLKKTISIDYKPLPYFPVAKKSS